MLDHLDAHGAAARGRGRGPARAARLGRREGEPGRREAVHSAAVAAAVALAAQATAPPPDDDDAPVVPLLVGG